MPFTPNFVISQSNMEADDAFIVCFGILIDGGNGANEIMKTILLVCVLFVACNHPSLKPKQDINSFDSWANCMVNTATFLPGR